jgi:hypothetical protein
MHEYQETKQKTSHFPSGQSTPTAACRQPLAQSRAWGNKSEGRDPPCHVVPVLSQDGPACCAAVVFGCHGLSSRILQSMLHVVHDGYRCYRAAGLVLPSRRPPRFTQRHLQPVRESRAFLIASGFFFDSFDPWRRVGNNPVGASPGDREAAFVVVCPPPLAPGVCRRTRLSTPPRRDRLLGRTALALALATALLALLRVPCATAVVSASERLGLVALYNATGGPSWASVPGWQDVYNAEVDPCAPSAWSGLTCATGPDRIMCVCRVGGSFLAWVCTRRSLGPPRFVHVAGPGE